MSIWDRIFVTWVEETKEADLIEIGLPENDYNKHNFIYDYWLCTLNTMKEIWNIINIQKLKNNQLSIQQVEVNKNISSLGKKSK